MDGSRKIIYIYDQYHHQYTRALFSKCVSYVYQLYQAPSGPVLSRKALQVLKICTERLFDLNMKTRFKTTRRKWLLIYILARMFDDTRTICGSPPLPRII